MDISRWSAPKARSHRNQRHVVPICTPAGVPERGSYLPTDATGVAPPLVDAERRVELQPRIIRFRRIVRTTEAMMLKRQPEVRKRMAMLRAGADHMPFSAVLSAES